MIFVFNVAAERYEDQGRELWSLNRLIHSSICSSIHSRTCNLVFLHPSQLGSIVGGLIYLGTLSPPPPPTPRLSPDFVILRPIQIDFFFVLYLQSFSLHWIISISIQTCSSLSYLLITLLNLLSQHFPLPTKWKCSCSCQRARSHSYFLFLSPTFNTATSPMDCISKTQPW